jgi:hypothetical protein
MYSLSSRVIRPGPAGSAATGDRGNASPNAEIAEMRSMLRRFNLHARVGVGNDSAKFLSMSGPWCSRHDAS